MKKDYLFKPKTIKVLVCRFVNEGRSFLIVKDRIRSFTTVTNDPSMTTITDDLSLMIVNNDPFLIDKIHFWSENIEEISLN